jgi:hypothetical protein
VFASFVYKLSYITIFCDSSGGQNKNFTLFRFDNFIVNVCGRLDTLKTVFPVRGHSYMECDRNVGLINQKSHIEVLDDWISVIANARVKPSPFSVVKCDQSMFFSWSDFFEKLNFSQKEFEVNSSKPCVWAIPYFHPLLKSGGETKNYLVLQPSE